MYEPQWVCFCFRNVKQGTLGGALCNDLILLQIKDAEALAGKRQWAGNQLRVYPVYCPKTAGRDSSTNPVRIVARINDGWMDGSALALPEHTHSHSGFRAPEWISERSLDSYVCRSYLGEWTLLRQSVLIGLSEHLFEGLPHCGMRPLFRGQPLQTGKPACVKSCF